MSRWSAAVARQHQVIAQLDSCDDDAANIAAINAALGAETRQARSER